MCKLPKYVPPAAPTPPFPWPHACQPMDLLPAPIGSECPPTPAPAGHEARIVLRFPIMPHPFPASFRIPYVSLEWADIHFHFRDANTMAWRGGPQVSPGANRRLDTGIWPGPQCPTMGTSTTWVVTGGGGATGARRAVFESPQSSSPHLWPPPPTDMAWGHWSEYPTSALGPSTI